MANYSFKYLCQKNDTTGTTAYFVLGGLSSVSIVENVLAITALLRTPKLRIRANLFVMSLICCDLVTAVNTLSVSITMHMPLTSDELRYANLFFFGYTSSVPCLLFINMAMIALDRYVYIVHPFYYDHKNTAVTFKVTLVVLWILTILYALLPFLIFRGEKYKSVCLVREGQLYYSFYIAWTIWIITSIVIFVCYFKISRLALKQNNKRASQITLNEPLRPSTRKQNKEKLLKVMRSVKMFSVVFAASVLCLFPVKIGLAIDTFIHRIPSQVYTWLIVLFVFHSSCNFFIYVVMSQEFRAAIIKLLKDLFDRFNVISCCARNNEKKKPVRFSSLIKAWL